MTNRKQERFAELASMICQWADEKGINNPIAQHSKTNEEIAELFCGLVKEDREQIKDDIGDIVVTLIIQYHIQQHLPEPDKAFVEVMDLAKPTRFSLFNFGMTVEGLTYHSHKMLVQLIRQEKNCEPNYDFIHGAETIMSFLHTTAEHYDLCLVEDCLEHAWNEIKHRTGKNVNGVFVKEVA